MISNFSRGGHFYAFNCAFYIEDFLNEHGISAEQECSNEALTEDTLKSDVGPIKPTLAQRIQNAASQAGKGVHDELSSSKHRDDGR